MPSLRLLSDVSLNEMATVDTEPITHNKTSISSVKYDWYQSETFVIVTILAKNAEDVEVVYTETTLSVNAKLLSDENYSLKFNLAHEIIPEECSHKVIPSKIEIKLKKREGLRWTVINSNLVSDNRTESVSQKSIEDNSTPPKYPSSSKKSKDWNKVEKEMEKEDEDEKPEGEAALNSLFQKIYSTGSDEVRRAMNKSFQESGGTVLSTNWSEVSKGTVECRPPNGLGWKSWN